MTADQKRKLVVEKYKTLLGRNNYNQSLRDYCFKKYKDGKYYSDCSSSISYSYREAGYDFGVLNTVGMYQSMKLINVDVIIKNGMIQDKDKLRMGDMLLFAGTDSSAYRSKYDNVGHVEMIYAISKGQYLLCGHPSKAPRLIDMDEYCRIMFNSKTKTKLGNRTLLKVVRFIEDDKDPEFNLKNWIKELQISLNSYHSMEKGYKKLEVDGIVGDLTEKELPVVRKGDVNSVVGVIQERLNSLGYECDVDNDFGKATYECVKKLQADNGISDDGVVGSATWKLLVK